MQENHYYHKEDRRKNRHLVFPDKSLKLFEESFSQLDVNTQRDIDRLIEQLPEII